MRDSIALNTSRTPNSLRLLQLPEKVREFVVHGKLSAGHARALITSLDAVSLAEKVIKDGMSVRQTEKLAKAAAQPDTPKPTGGQSRAAPEKDADTKMLEGDLAANLGMKVSINHTSGQESGQIKIDYKSLDQLDRLCQLLGASY